MSFQRCRSDQFAHFARLLVLGMGLLFMQNCTRQTPVDFAAGEYPCEFCKMNIVQMKFKAEILSPKGKVFRFDSIECMLSWAKDHPDSVKSRWVSDFNAPHGWLPFEQARYLRSAKRPSPMGANFSAYATPEAALQAHEHAGGEVLEPQQLWLNLANAKVPHARQGEQAIR